MVIFLHLPWRIGEGRQKKWREEWGLEEVNNFILQRPGDDKIESLALCISHTHSQPTLHTEIISCCLCLPPCRTQQSDNSLAETL